MFRWFVISFCFWMFSSMAFARESLPLDTGNTEISLVSDHDTVAPGHSFTVALRMKFDGNWYTYWRNAGDSGEPVNILWDLPEGVTAGPIQWPVPKIKTVGPIVSYAMGGDVWLPVEITLDETVSNTQPITLKAHAYFLVCDDVCIPEDGALTLPIAIGATALNPDHSTLINAVKDKVPQRGVGDASAQLKDGQLNIDMTGLPSGFTAAKFYPHDNLILAHSEPITLIKAENGLRFTATPNYGWEAAVPSSFDATLVGDDGKASIIRVATDKTVNIGSVAAAVVSKTDGASLSLGGAALGAFLGGLILNLMPCVFPIISLKALSLAKTAHGERQAIRRAGWSYTAGVLVSFAAFAALLIGLKAAGGSVGWGFQLQSPWLVGLLALLLFGIGLNLLGVFELGGRFQNIGSGAVDRAGPFSSFLTGVLAVIVATPCSAPFMAGAVGYALASSAIITLTVFLALGLGFALPFLLVAYVPGLLARLPKPGPWMETFRQFLAFPMFAAAIWLVWVLSLQAGTSGLSKLLVAGLALSFAIWSLQKKGIFAKAIGGLAIVSALIIPLTLQASTAENSSAELDAMAWSPQAVAAARDQGRPVFVDFTAAWCVTCKFNEGLVLKTQKTAKLFERTNTEVLIADWTNKDDVIAAELERFGRAGVPLYLVYKPGAEEAEILPQTLSYGVLKAALE